jgi:tetrahydromethanopterin S-methyltransferase subunit G
MSENEAPLVVSSEVEIVGLQERIQELEAQVETLDARVPDIWILSDNLLKRAFGVYGYYLLAAMIVAVPIVACSLLGAFFFGLLAFAVGSGY